MFLTGESSSTSALKADHLGGKKWIQFLFIIVKEYVKRERSGSYSRADFGFCKLSVRTVVLLYVEVLQKKNIPEILSKMKVTTTMVKFFNIGTLNKFYARVQIAYIVRPINHHHAAYSA